MNYTNYDLLCDALSLLEEYRENGDSDATLEDACSTVVISSGVKLFVLHMEPLTKVACRQAKEHLPRPKDAVVGVPIPLKRLNVRIEVVVVVHGILVLGRGDALVGLAVP